MVRRKTFLSRSAFTMIELIFAIVVIAISVISLPVMLQTTSKNIETNILQEAIFAASAIINQSTTFHWDSNSLAEYSSINLDAKVIDTGDCDPITHKRVGHVNRVCLDDSNITLFDRGTYKSTFDYNQSLELAAQYYNNTSIISGATSAASYKDEYRASVDVSECNNTSTLQFGLEALNPDLKEITVKVADDKGDTLVILRAYSANIGEIRPKSEVY